MLMKNSDILVVQMIGSDCSMSHIIERIAFESNRESSERITKFGVMTHMPNTYIECTSKGNLDVRMVNSKGKIQMTIPQKNQDQIQQIEYIE